MYRNRVFLCTLVLALGLNLGCGLTRYNPEPDRDQYIVRPRWPLNRMPTKHERRTYEIYKDNPKKLSRWYDELKERENE